MKLSKKFFEDLHKIGEDAFIEKNMWIGKLVPDIIVDNLKKRGITPDDLEGVVYLSVEEAKAIQEKLNTFLICAKPRYEKLMKKDISLLSKRIKQAEGK